MSRIGRLPVVIPAGVEVKISEKNLVSVKGPKGSLEKQLPEQMEIKQEGNEVMVTRPNDLKQMKALHGLTRSLLNNMVIGVTQGFKKSLTVNGVGFKVTKQGNKLVMNLGLSHPVEVVEENGVKLNVPSITEIVVEGVSKEAVGAMAAKIRAIKPVEPYHGYGIRYTDEKVSLKEGKSSGKGGKK